MTTITREELNEINAAIKADEKQLKKPISAYQYYMKAMREKWKSLSQDEANEFHMKSDSDAERYRSEREKIRERHSDKILSKNIYLVRSYGSVPCVGLDNHFVSYEVIGPIKKVEIYTQEERDKLIAKGVPKDKIYYKSVGGIPFNWRAAKKYSVKVFGGSTNNSDTWYGIRENYDGPTKNYTKYTNYKGETWIEYH